MQQANNPGVICIHGSIMCQRRHTPDKLFCFSEIQYFFRLQMLSIWSQVDSVGCNCCHFSNPTPNTNHTCPRKLDMAHDVAESDRIKKRQPGQPRQPGNQGNPWFFLPQQKKNKKNLATRATKATRATRATKATMLTKQIVPLLI